MPARADSTSVSLVNNSTMPMDSAILILPLMRKEIMMVSSVPVMRQESALIMLRYALLVHPHAFRMVTDQ